MRACDELQGLSILSPVNRGYHVLPLPALGAPIAAMGLYKLWSVLGPSVLLGQ